MTYTDHSTLPTELLEQISQEGLDYLPELIRIVVNAAMQAERQKHLGAEMMVLTENSVGIKSQSRVIAPSHSYI